MTWVLCHWGPDELTFSVLATSLSVTPPLQTISDKSFIDAFAPVPFVQSHMQKLFCLCLPNREAGREIFPPPGRGKAGNKPTTVRQGEHSRNHLKRELGPWRSNTKLPGQFLYISVGFISCTLREMGGEVLCLFSSSKGPS